jgi:uroporphyrinogen III methyltransferase / synthase
MCNPPEGPLSELTILVDLETTAEWRSQLADAGAHVISFPKFSIEAPDSYAALDEAIENLYGYDWLIFIKSHSVSYFLKRFRELGHETSELDSLRVCALGESTVESLEAAQVHVDVVPEQMGANDVLRAVATYAGGPDGLRGLNFLVPQALIGRDYLKDELVEIGARADVVAAYRTVTLGDLSLTRLQTLILSGGVDCLVLANEAGADHFAALFDLNDLSRLLRDVAVVSLDDSAAEAATRLGIRNVIKPAGPSFSALIETLASLFSR